MVDSLTSNSGNEMVGSYEIEIGLTTFEDLESIGMTTSFTEDTSSLLMPHGNRDNPIGWNMRSQTSRCIHRLSECGYGSSDSVPSKETYMLHMEKPPQAAGVRVMLTHSAAYPEAISPVWD